ncbi:hypothetical protein [Nocardia xishanensis]
MRIRTRICNAGKGFASLLAAGAAAVFVTDHDEVVEATHRYTSGAGADIVLDSVMGPGLADLTDAAKRFSGAPDHRRLRSRIPPALGSRRIPTAARRSSADRTRTTYCT